jgi:pyruvate,water dikinase
MESVTTRAPEQFPQEWTPPGDDDTYMLDPMHFPFPITPLTESTLGVGLGVGFSRAAREYRTPILAVKIKSRNLYHFERYEMAHPASEAEARQMGELAEATLKPEIGRMLQRWNEEHLPAVRALIERVRTMDLDSPPASEMPALIDELEHVQHEAWTIHFRIAIPMLLSLQIFDDFYADVFGDEGDGHALLVGTASESVKAGLALYDVAMKAKALGLAPLIEQTPPDEMMALLASSEAGRAFATALTNYLDQYGLRQDLFDYGVPTWQEDHVPALLNVRGYLQTGRDERAIYAEKQEAAERALAAARSQLAAYPEAVRGQFEELHKIGRAGAFLQEEHNFYIDQQLGALMRLAFRRIGARLVREGVLKSPEDVFMFNIDELRNLFANPEAAKQVEFVRSMVETRRDQLEQARKLTPPPFIGAPPAGPPPSGSPIDRALLRFFGGPPKQAEASNQLKGNAGSRGIVSGVAYVARTLEEAGGVQPGQVLVAVTTMPPWTPLFGIAAAVVTETGGPLSHCAIVAREYGIPAVVGAHGATRAIRTGQRITVDGGRGIVTIED